jgi:hypothetical protein
MEKRGVSPCSFPSPCGEQATLRRWLAARWRRPSLAHHQHCCPRACPVAQRRRSPAARFPTDWALGGCSAGGLPCAWLLIGKDPTFLLLHHACTARIAHTPQLPSSARPPTATTPNPLQGSKRAHPESGLGPVGQLSSINVCPSARHGQIVACPLRPCRARGANIKTTQPAIEKTFPTDEGERGRTRRRREHQPPRLTAPLPLRIPVAVAACDGQQSSILLDAAMRFMFIQVQGPIHASPCLPSIPGLPALVAASVSDPERRGGARWR